MLEKIQSVELTSAASQITLNNVPTTGSGLFIVATLWANNAQEAYLQINGSGSATKMAYRRSGPSTGDGQSNVFYIGYSPENYIGTFLFDIPLHAKNGEGRGVVGYGGSTGESQFTKYLSLSNTFWPNTNITTIAFTGNQFQAKSKVDLYLRK